MEHFLPPKSLRKLTIEVTTQCNLKCAGCPRTIGIANGNWTDFHMELEMFERILKHLPKVGFVTLHGIGEPTLHPQFQELVSMANASGKFERMKVTTNGLTRSTEYYKNLVANGLDEFWISVDSFDPVIANQMREGTKVEKLKRRIGDMIEENLPVHVSMVVSATNYRDIPDTLNHLYDLGMPPVYMQEFQDYGDGYGLMDEEKRREFSLILADTMKSLPGMLISPPNYVHPKGDYCTAPWFRPAITAQGFFTPCCTTFDPSQFGYVNLGELSFAQAWQQPSLLKWIEKFLDNKTKICQGCSLNPRNFGVENVLGKSGKKGTEEHILKRII